MEVRKFGSPKQPIYGLFCFGADKKLPNKIYLLGNFCFGKKNRAQSTKLMLDGVSLFIIMLLAY